MTKSPYDNLPIGKDEITESNTGYMEVPLETLETSETSEASEKPSDDRKKSNIIDESSDSEALSASYNNNITGTETPILDKVNKNREPYKPTRRDSLPPAYCDRMDITRTSPLAKAPQYTKSSLKNRCSIREFILPFEESLLVPDTMPDMTEIFFTEAKVSVTRTGKTSYGPGDTLSGEITFYTVYRPDIRSNSPLDVIKSIIPFRTDKCWGNSETSVFKVSVSAGSCKADMLNERKFTAKGELSIHLTEIMTKEINILKNIDDPDFMLQEDTVDITELTFETEETAEISQEIKISDNDCSPAKILKEDIKIVETHKQITSGKLIINAVINTQILYISREDGDNKLCSINSKTDFTQFIVLKSGSDMDLVKAEFLSDDLNVTIDNSSGFVLEGNVRILIQGYKNRETKIISDAYHKEKDLKFDISLQPVCNIKETVSGEISAREVISIDEDKPKPGKLLCGSIQQSSVTGRFEGSRIIIEGSLPVKVLALDENNEPFIIESTIPLRGSLDAASAESRSSADIWSVIKDIWIDNINSRQVEINVSVSIEVWVNALQEFKTLENLCFAERKDSQDRVSMALYIVGPGDTLWDIAKKYKSDINALAQFNQIDTSAPLPEGMKLFITK